MRMQLLRTWFPWLGRLLMIGGGLVVLLLTIAWLSGMFTEKIEPGWAERGLRRHSDEPTDRVQRIKKAYLEEAVGTLKASSRTLVAAKVLATIDEILVAAGDEVEQGQLLVQLDDDEYQTRLDQAKRALEAATANRMEAENQFERIETLVEQNAASRAEYDRAARDLQVTIADEARARQAVSEAAVLLSYTTISAAKSGRIVDRLSEPGDVVQPGTPILTLYDARSLRLEAPVAENLAVKLSPGDELDVYIDALNQAIPSRVDEIVPQADAPSRTFLVKAELPTSEELYEGMFGRLRIPAGEREHLCVASDAILRIGQLEFVDVVGADGLVERRLIKSGQLGLPGRQEVLSGLEAGERVIVPDSAAPSRENGSNVR